MAWHDLAQYESLKRTLLTVLNSVFFASLCFAMLFISSRIAFSSSSPLHHNTFWMFDVSFDVLCVIRYIDVFFLFYFNMISLYFILRSPLSVCICINCHRSFTCWLLVNQNHWPQQCIRNSQRHNIDKYSPRSIS